jgi:drug/metabolite transporter (DMT)-like permease
MNLTDRQKGIAALVTLALVFASIGLFARYLSTNFSVFQQVYMRVGAALTIALIVFRKELDFSKLKKISKKEWLVLLLRAVSMYVFGVTLFSQAIVLAKYSNVSFIGGLPMTALLGFVLLKERISLWKIVFIVLAMLGVLLIAVQDFTQIWVWGYGEMLALISTFFFALSYVTRRWQTNLLNNKEMTIIVFVLSFVLLFISSLGLGDGLPNPTHGWTIPLILAIMGAGIFNIMNLFLVNYGFDKVEAVLASNILTIESLFAIIIGFIAYGEAPVLKELIGGALIVTSVIAMNEVEKREKAKNN